MAFFKGNILAINVFIVLRLFSVFKSSWFCPPGEPHGITRPPLSAGRGAYLENAAMESN